MTSIIKQKFNFQTEFEQNQPEKSSQKETEHDLKIKESTEKRLEPNERA